MKPAAFDYVRVDTTEQALEILAQHGDDARVLAGGQSLMAMLNMRLAQPKVLIDLMHVAHSDTIRVENGMTIIPAAVRQSRLALHPGLSHDIPLLAKVMPWIGHVQTRARGTVCGSIAHADPSAELPLVLAALGGEAVLRNTRRRRTVAAADFFLGIMVTEKSEDELIEEVRLPLAQPGAGCAFYEVGRRKGDFAIVSCAAIVQGHTTRIAIGGVNDTPFVQDWQRLEPDQTADALNVLAWSLDARDDLHATARYRRDLVRNLGKQAIEEARKCAT